MAHSSRPELQGTRAGYPERPSTSERLPTGKAPPLAASRRGAGTPGPFSGAYAGVSSDASRVTPDDPTNSLCNVFWDRPASHRPPPRRRHLGLTRLRCRAEPDGTVRWSHRSLLAFPSWLMAGHRVRRLRPVLPAAPRRPPIGGREPLAGCPSRRKCAAPAPPRQAGPGVAQAKCDRPACCGKRPS